MDHGDNQASEDSEGIVYRIFHISKMAVFCIYPNNGFAQLPVHDCKLWNTESLTPKNLFKSAPVST